MTSITPAPGPAADTSTMKRNAYTVEQLKACLAAAEARYNTSTTCAEARSWLDQTHALRDRIGFAEVRK